MTPLFACIPVCMTFLAIALIGGVVVVFDMAKRQPGDDQPAPASDDLPGTTGPPPWWVLPLMMLSLALLMLVLGWYWPE